MRPRGETLLAVLIGLAAFSVYRLTLYPGLVGSGDTPELQFVGAVLGTAHTPGYPLYVLLSWAFAQLPFGTLAHRINLMSACFASLAAALAFPVCRRLGCRPVVAATTALALAFGPVFWSQATLAEVYTLAGALLLGVLAALLRWEATRGAAALWAAMACGALGLGHHYSDIVTAAPAFLLFVALTDRGVLRRPRILGAGLLFLALGLAQYGFILLRTRQPAPYLGARAADLHELLVLLRGGSFESRLFAFGPRALLTERLPALGRLLLAELGPAGLVLLVVGLAVLVARRRRHAALLLLGAAGPAVFALNYDVPDLSVFLLPAFLLLWPAVGVGLEAAAARLARIAPAAAAGSLALALPVAQLLSNYRASDHHRHDFEMRYFAALFEALPARAALLSETYTVDQMIRYELFGERRAGGRDVVLAGRDVESVEAYRRRGYTLFAFESGRRELSPLGYRFAPFPLADGSLADHLEALPRGSLVLLAGNDAAAGRALAATGRVAGAPGLTGSGCVALIGVVGAAGGAAVRLDPVRAEVAARQGDALAGTSERAPADLLVLARREGALAEVNGRPMARVDHGLAAVVIPPRGRVTDRLELEDPVGGARVPFNPRAFPAYRLEAGPECTDLGNVGWVDVTARAAGARLLVRIDDVEPFDARIVLYMAGPAPFEPRLAGVQGRGTPRLTRRAFAGAGGHPDPGLLAALRADGLGGAPALRGAAFVERLQVDVNDQGDFSALTLDLGGVPTLALADARVDRDSPPRAQACALPAGGDVFFESADETRARIGFGSEGAGFLGFGWHGPERDGPVVFRWTAGREAALLVPLLRAASLHVRVLAMPPSDPGAPPPTLELVVNGIAAEARPLRPGWAFYEWTVPARAWRAGTNEVRVRVSRVRAPGGAGESRPLGVALGQFHLVRLGGA